MRLCVGAASQIVVEEAAKLGVAQVIASRSQVGEFEPGYTGYTSQTLVDTVRQLSHGQTRVVRDHGGPYQNGNSNDNWLAALDEDVQAGFDGLHLDVCKLNREQQTPELRKLCQRYADKPVWIEVGGERDSQMRLYQLLNVAQRECEVHTAVAALGGKIWADKQYGSMITDYQIDDIRREYASMGVKMKAHNWDWMGGRQKHLCNGNGFYNIAPEFGNVEVDAWLRVVGALDMRDLLDFGYKSMKWRKWYNGSMEGTQFEQARTGLRYCLEMPYVRNVLNLYRDDYETYVRETVRDAIQYG